MHFTIFSVGVKSTDLLSNWTPTEKIETEYVQIINGLL